MFVYNMIRVIAFTSHLIDYSYTKLHCNSYTINGSELKKENTNSQSIIISL